MNRLLLLAPLLAITACASASPHEIAAQHERNRYWGSAVDSYAAILDQDPNDGAARAGYKRAADAYMAERRALVEGAVAQGELASALKLADETEQRIPDHPDALALLNEVAQRTQDAAVQASRVDRYERAVRLNEALAMHAPDLAPTAGAEIDGLLKRWLEHTVKTAAQAERDGRAATATLLWAKAHELSGDATHLDRSRAARASAVIEEAWRVQLVLLNPPLRGRLEQHPWPEGMEVALVSTPSPGATVARAALSSVTCQNSSQQLQRTVRVVVGEERVPNQWYQRELNEVQAAQDRVWGAERELARARGDRQHALRRAEGQPQGSPAWQEYDRANRRVSDAERELRWREDQLISERADLSRHPAYDVVPIYRDEAYPVTRVTRRCVSRLDVAVGADAPTSNEVSIATEDDTHPSFPTLGLNQDPLQLTADAELAAKIEQGALEAITARLLDGFRGHRQSVLARAQSAQDRLIKLEDALRYALLAQDEIHPDTLRFIQDESGVDNVAHLLVRR